MPLHTHVHALSLFSDIGLSLNYSAALDTYSSNNYDDIVSQQHQQCHMPPHCVMLRHHLHYNNHSHPMISTMSLHSSARGSSACSSSCPSPTSSIPHEASPASASDSTTSTSTTTRSAPVHNLSNRTFSSLSALVVNDSAGYAVSPDGRLRIPLTASLRARQCTATSHLQNRQRRSNDYHHGQFISSSLSSSLSSSSSSRFQQSKPETNHNHDPSSPSSTTKTTIKNDPLTPVVVYVIDTGCRVSHRELYPRAISLPAPGSPYPSGADDHGHGTHVAARIAGLSFGLAPHARIVCVKALSRHNEGSSKDVVSALNLVIRLHTHAMREHQKKRRRSTGAGTTAAAAVVCISLGVAAPRRYTDLDKAVTKASRHGIVSVVAAGNSARNACHFTPARAPGAISIAAASQSATSYISSLSSSIKKNVKQNHHHHHHAMVTSGRALAPFSNFGPCVTVAAPGVHVWSAVASGDDAYGVSSGTSMAAPFVAGLIALVQRTHGAVSHRFVAAMLRDIATSVDGVPVVSVDGLCRWLGVVGDDNVEVDGDNNKENVESRHSNHQSQSQSQSQLSPQPDDAGELTPSEDSRIQRTAQHEQKHEQQTDTETQEQGSHQEREQRRRRRLNSRFHQHWYKTRDGHSPDGVYVGVNDVTDARSTNRELHMDVNNREHHHHVGNFRNDEVLDASYRQRGRRVGIDSEHQQEMYERHHPYDDMQQRTQQRQMRQLRRKERGQRRVREFYQGGTTGERVRVVHVDDDKNENDMDIDWDVVDMDTKVDVNDNDTDIDTDIDNHMDMDVGRISAGSAAATAATTGNKDEETDGDNWRQMRDDTARREHQYRGTWSKLNRRRSP